MKITIIGIGLIGGSIAAASKHAGVKQVVAYDQNADALDKALHMKIIDQKCEHIANAVNKADLIIIAVPPSKLINVLKEIQPVLTKQQLVTDTLSLNGLTNENAEQILGDQASQFITSHPLAGSEKSGVEYAQKELFANKQVVLSPNILTKRKTIQQVEKFWQLIGANTLVMAAEKHDALLAATSHLPHVLSYAYSKTIVENQDKKEIAHCSAGSFRDLTRIATSNSMLWTDICSSNRIELINMIDQFEQNLITIKQALLENNTKQLQSILKKATTIKNWREQ